MVPGSPVWRASRQYVTELWGHAPRARALNPPSKVRDSVEVASAWLAPLLVVAITDEATDWPSCNSE
jgi:hypothetical protein